MSIERDLSQIERFVTTLETQTFDVSSSEISETPNVSIISYLDDRLENFDRQFDRTWKTLLNQTYRDFEWLLVADRTLDPSTLSGFNDAREGLPKLHPIALMSNPSLASAWNLGVSKAQGQYFLFLEIGDLLDPTYLEKCLLVLEVYPKLSFINTYGITLEPEVRAWESGFHQPSKIIENPLISGSVLYRKVDFDSLGSFDETLTVRADWERWLKAIAHRQIGWTIPEHLHVKTRSIAPPTQGDRHLELERTTQMIRSRYLQFFSQFHLKDLSLPRAPFNTETLSKTLALDNGIRDTRSQKRVLCCLSYLEVGGADKFNLDLFGLLVERGYDLTIATTVESDHPWHEKFYEITPDIFHLTHLFPNNHWLTFLRHILTSRQIDVVFLSISHYTYYLLPILRQEFPEVAFIDYTHTDDPGWYGIGLPRLSCQMAEFLDLQVVASQYLVDFYLKIDAEVEENLRVCHINVDTQKWHFSEAQRQQVRDRLGISEDAALLLYPARIVPQKRPLFFVEILKALVDRSLPIAVVVLGKGYLLEQMEAKIEEYDLGSVVRILPTVFPEEMLGFYSAADILLLPSEYEGISMAIYEAMSMQLPVVASEVGGQKELVTPETGFLLPKGRADQSELQEYLDVLEPLIRDPQRRRQLGEAARQRVEKFFSLQVMVEIMEGIFAEAIQRCQNRSHPGVTPAVAQEMVILIQEFLALEKMTTQQWQSTEKWVKELQRSRELAEYQCQAWKEAAKITQLELNETQAQLERARAEFALLKSQLSSPQVEV
ncbi:MAG: glycosyltransferase [Cyanobacteriota bacterium]|nr:glycosyltransferase [Cyanobacteriota bacterium]